MTTIIGVDFSGAEKEGKTWAAQGQLSEDSILTLDPPQRIQRENLYKLVVELPPPAVVATDFPFGVPAAFAKYICGGVQPSELPDVWRRVAAMDKDEFVAARNAFVADNSHESNLSKWCCEGEPIRVCDARYPESFSPIHIKGKNVNMVPMTYEGNRLLHRWYQNDPKRWYVPPLPLPDGAGGERVTLLEVMPGMLLKEMNLPFKGFKNGQHFLELRTIICDGLEKASGVRLPNLGQFRKDCLANDDCLDAVVAAVGAAMWAQDAGQFRHPDKGDLDKARLEGCIFAPLPRAQAR